MGQGKNSQYPDPKDLEGQTSVVSMIITGQYRIVYDRGGLQSGNGSTWYAFQIIAGQGQVIGEYHIHPRRGGGFASGNLRLFANNSFGEILIGQARDWQWLCDHVSGQVPSQNTSRNTYRPPSNQSSSSGNWGRR